MAAVTDPAREMSELCARLYSGVGTRGDQFLAEAFGVPAWSPEFFQILSSIVERTDFLIRLVEELDLDEDLKQEAVSHIEAVKGAFRLEALMNTWNSTGTRALGPDNVQPIKMLSSTIRQKVAYPKLTDEELLDVLAEVDQLAGWLSEHQAKEHDFIRQALLDGLGQFRSRLARIGWFGWGYTLDSLREVIGAYMALEHGLPAKGADPVAEAILKKTAAFVKNFYEKTQLFKGVVETGDLMLRAYGAASLLAHGGSIAGLLTSSASSSGSG